ncbi:excalibur calcium-binding domain-containing protein [Mesorhizobium sp. M8A.F.Ca.ET.202.01.1.1]|nr:excalibur calcium-binding domain-containing protein [Mesorhizobium sp. M8A.F.Ca.ET.023.01.1.1]RWC75271.1 MAG: excalibur calcium-binding domain-containing protein [Mesorhizobium sp.]TGR29267.1 excalibur calcium-binding domain-containing protein [Mesorhizobium sp. M8A.F.Ca.ET.202.01.1.1]TGR30000.1 excalibur calcium-binding domain-containing protein [Mesorhizobium sp. M8A.F.Ca.ET.197.01.1.1]TGR47155.1 excalibur calcium-binding domain-containing protein [bacterium M00.F.Ca.ET.199.01.1.1]TGR5557
MLLPLLHWHVPRRYGGLKWAALFAPFILLSGYIVYGFIGIQIDSPLSALRHLAAFPNCAAARAVGLAPARKGQPGYWPTHDADKDGIACEPWHGESGSGVKVHRYWRTGR